MKMPIPQDWNGENWYCVQIQWPDSPFWTAILQGFISLPSFGYFWDEKTGAVKEIQQVGFEIHRRNMPLLDCAGEIIKTITETETVTETIYVFTDGNGEGEMTGCYIPRGAARVQNGVLQFRDICGDWYDVATIQDLSATETDEPLPGADPADDATYSTCGKAQGFIKAVKAVAFAAWEAALLDPTQWESTVRSSLDWATMGRSSLYLTVASAQTLRQLSSEGTVFDANRWQQMACMALAGMSDSPVMSEDDRLYALDSIRSVVFSATISAPAKESYWNLLKNASDTIGKNDGRQAGNMGALSLSEDCACPGDSVPIGEEYATSGGYYLGAAVADHEANDAGDGYVYWRETFTAPHDVFGLVARVKWPAGDGTTIKHMSYDNAGGNDPYDALATTAGGDTSAHWENYPQETYIFLCQSATIMYEIVAALSLSPTYYDGNWGGWVADVSGATLPAKWKAANATLIGAQVERNSTSIDTLDVVLYPIYNVNSASHA